MELFDFYRGAFLFQSPYLWHHSRLAWDMDQLVRLIEVNIGKDLQFIRFNGAMVGGLAGLALYTGEILLKLV